MNQASNVSVLEMPLASISRGCRLVLIIANQLHFKPNINKYLSVFRYINISLQFNLPVKITYWHIVTLTASILLFAQDVFAVEQSELQRLEELMVRGCSLGEKIDLQVNAGAGISILKRGLTGDFSISRSEIPNIINFLTSDIQRSDQADKIRNCMTPYMNRIFDAILGKDSSSLPDNELLNSVRINTRREFVEDKFGRAGWELEKEDGCGVIEGYTMSLYNLIIQYNLKNKIVSYSVVATDSRMRQPLRLGECLVGCKSFAEIDFSYPGDFDFSSKEYIYIERVHFLSGGVTLPTEFVYYNGMNHDFSEDQVDADTSQAPFEYLTSDERERLNNEKYLRWRRLQKPNGYGEYISDEHEEECYDAYKYDGALYFGWGLYVATLQ